MTMWGGRFEERMSEMTRTFTSDHSDRRLLDVDIRGSIAHAEMLAATGLITAAESRVLVDGLRSIQDGELVFHDDDEDVHTAVERRLAEIVGEVAGKLHTGRSRNDQVALDLRLYLAKAGRARVDQLHRLALAIAGLAEGHAETIVPSYTHLQQAQPTTLGHHLLAYAWMMLRGADRFRDALVRIEASPLGSGASAGSSLGIDRSMSAQALGLTDVIPNSLDAVGSRDFVAEYVFSCAQAMVDLSRLAEDVVLWSTREFGWARLGDEVSTGSSALPQKRNPDIAELVRGRAATLVGDLSAILALQKGLPLSYNRDLQEDKRIVFHADDTLAAAVDAMGELLVGIELDPPRPGPETTALDLAEALVGRGVAFREAHRAVGGLIRALEADGRSLGDAAWEDLAAADDWFEPADLDLIDPAVSVERRVSEGSGSPGSVRDQVAAIRGILSNVIR